MSRISQESSTAFGEVLRPASQNYFHNPQAVSYLMTTG